MVPLATISICCHPALGTKVDFSCSVLSDSLQPHESQHARPPCRSPGVHSDSCPLSQWCHPAISSSVVPFSSCPQYLPASESFDLLQNKLAGSPCSPRDSQESSPTPHFKSINSSVLSLPNGPTLTSVCDCWKNHGSDYMELVGKVLRLLFNMLFRFVIAFLLRSKHFLILWPQSQSSVILEHKKRKLATVSTFPHLFAMKWWEQMPWS